MNEESKKIACEMSDKIFSYPSELHNEILILIMQNMIDRRKKMADEHLETANSIARLNENLLKVLRGEVNLGN